MSSKQAILLSKLGNKKKVPTAESAYDGADVPSAESAPSEKLLSAGSAYDKKKVPSIESDETPIPKTKALMDASSVPSANKAGSSLDFIRAAKAVPGTLKSANSVPVTKLNTTNELGDSPVPSADSLYSPIKKYLNKRK